ncbi:MAG: hypothetical protein IKC35_01580 [Clostridia bacterium]|nr:hypothetical protein [Clostridia bacterium]
MNDKLKRVVAIIALVFIGIFTVSLIMYLIDSTMLNGAIGDLTIWSGGIGLMLWLVLYISRSFPSQQVKDEERERLYRQAEELENAELEQGSVDKEEDLSNEQAEEITTKQKSE